LLFRHRFNLLHDRLDDFLLGLFVLIFELVGQIIEEPKHHMLSHFRRRIPLKVAIILFQKRNCPLFDFVSKVVELPRCQLARKF
jgi:hypothetical protein